MKRFRKHLVIVGFALLLAGCGRSSSFEEPPRERHELVMRFFESMRGNRPREAVRQAENLLKLDVGNRYLKELIYIQSYNAVILEAQKALNEGRFAEADAALVRGANEISVNRSLLNERRKIQKLRSLKTAFADMEKAENADAKTMQSALDRAVSLAGEQPPAGVSLRFSRFRQKLELRRRQGAAAPVEPAAKP